MRLLLLLNVVVFLYALLGAAAYQPPLALVIYGCHKENLHWTQYLSASIPVFHVGCGTLGRIGQPTSQGCSEGHGYLEWVIANYELLKQDWPAVNILFMHAHEKSWHYSWQGTEVAAHEQIATLSATTTYLKNNTFGGLYCHYNDVYAPAHWSHSEKLPPELTWDEIFNGTDVTYPKSFYYPCCGTFWVRSRKIAERPRHVYETILNNIYRISPMRSKLGICGRVLESAWHILFGNQLHVVLPSYCSSQLQ